MAADDNVVEITFDGQTDKFELTLGEIEELEDAFNLPASEINYERMKATRMIVGFALRRRQRNRDPKAIDAELYAMDLNEFMRRGEASPPTKAKGGAKPA